MTEVERLTKIAQKACDETFEKQTEINQLRAEIEKLRHDWAVACKDLGEALAEVERLNRDGSDLAAIIRRQGFQVERLHEQVASLQAWSGYEVAIAQVKIERLQAALQDIVDYPHCGPMILRAIARVALEPKP